MGTRHNIGVGSHIVFIDVYLYMEAFSFRTIRLRFLFSRDKRKHLSFSDWKIVELHGIWNRNVKLSYIILDNQSTDHRTQVYKIREDRSGGVDNPLGFRIF